MLRIDLPTLIDNLKEAIRRLEALDKSQAQRLVFQRNQVGNLAAMKDGDYLGYVDILNGEVVI